MSVRYTENRASREQRRKLLSFLISYFLFLSIKLGTTYGTLYRLIKKKEREEIILVSCLTELNYPSNRDMATQNQCFKQRLGRAFWENPHYTLMRGKENQVKPDNGLGEINHTTGEKKKSLKVYLDIQFSIRA